MLRITRVDAAADHDLAIKLEGKLLQPWVPEVAREYESAKATEGGADHLTLDLSAVSFIDAAGTDLVRSLMSRGVRVTGCSPFIAELLHAETTP